MIIEFGDECWSNDDVSWKQSLVELLSILARRHQHALIAKIDLILPWCGAHLASHSDYFRTRLASTQIRANSITVRISPSGSDAVAGDPPWNLTAQSAFELVNQPLRLVLENDKNDRVFVESTISSFAGWCLKKWVEPHNGGGSDMQTKIKSASGEAVGRWRTFFLFDSDRLHPAELAQNWAPPAGDSCQGYKFEIDCINMPINRWHRLRRRSIENYLPRSLLETKNLALTTELYSQAVGDMADFYNFKQGLQGDGVHPFDPGRRPRAERSSGFWTSLPADVIAVLKDGYGKAIAQEFDKVPSNYVWPSSVLNEMSALSDALQDAM